MASLFQCSAEPHSKQSIEIYIVKYRQSSAFGNIDIGSHFSVAHEGKDFRKLHKSPFVFVLNITIVH